ncbi:hypothetical protein QN239_25705 [Mycolicibacterium sp. Y3]
MIELFQLLAKDMLVVGDQQRIDAWIKPGVPAGKDRRVWGLKYYARRAGLVLHTARSLGNEDLSYDLVESLFNQGRMVDSRYMLYVSPEYRDVPLSELDTLLPMRTVHDDLGSVYVSPPLS